MSTENESAAGATGATTTTSPPEAARSNSEIKIEMESEKKQESVKLQKHVNNGAFEWNDVNLEVKVGKGEFKKILTNVTGKLPPGQLLAIMGGSGAGKSSLLNALSGRVLSERNSKKLTGEVAWNGKKFELGHSDAIKAVIAYVMQSDILSATQTVEEAFQFSAKLRLPEETTDEERNNIVNNVIAALKLEKCRNTLIGNDAIRGISGGEKKRTSVGVELVTNPDLIFLDEPTSGLDSYTAMKTLEILKGLTQEGKQVIATIHQPSSEIWNLLDQLCLLAEGHCVYFGPTSKVLEYFKSVGHECPQFTNPADFVVNRVQANSKFFIDAWKQHFETHKELGCNFTTYEHLKPVATMHSSFWTQIGCLFTREFKILQRDPRPTRVRLIQSIIFALLIGILYYNLGHGNDDLRNRFGAVFFLTVNTSMTGAISTVLTFPEQRLLFERERNNNMYPTTTYVVVKSLVQMPESCVFALVYLLICFWMVGFDSAFWEMYVSIILCVNAMGSVGLIIGTVARNVTVAIQLFPVTFIPFLLFANYLVSLDQIPVWIRWVQWLDVFKYMISALAITEFRGQTYHVDGQNGQTVPLSGNDYLESLDVDRGDLGFDWYMMAVLLVAFRLVALVILVYKNGY